MKAWGILVLACAAPLLALPSGAVAKPGYKVRPGGTHIVIPLGEKGDYWFALEADERQQVVLSVEEGLFATTEYKTKGRVSNGRIEADLGELGRIDIELRLAPGQSEREPQGKNCEGHPSVFVPGTYRGTIEFSGEGDVPAATFRRGGVALTRNFRQVCKPRQPASNAKGGRKPKPKTEIGYLAVHGKGEGRTIALEAFSLAPRRSPARSLGILLAEAYERDERVRIARSLLGFFDHKSFVMSRRGKKPETVRVKLPDPFAGRALYSRSPGSPATWSGNLSLDLPGADRIPFTGPGVESVFCRGFTFAGVERCLYGSGSHSQPLALARLSSLR